MAPHELHSRDCQELALGFDLALELIEPARLGRVRACQACPQTRELLLELSYPRSNYLVIVAERLHNANLLQ